MKKEIVGVIGLGYVGAPLAYLVATKEYQVIGIDNDLKKINAIREEKMLPTQLTDIYKDYKKNLLLTNDYNELKNADIVIICVPTPTIDDVPDLSILNKVIESLAFVMKKGSLIIIESTIAPGMTRKYVQEKLYEINGLEINKDYELAYCPERIDPGNKKYWVGNINRVCGATSNDTLNKVCNFYEDIIDAKIIPMQSIEEAELVKVWENSIRNMRIAQANLLAKIADKYNFSVKRLINGLNSKVEQFGLSIAFPGIGPGGHCIPEDIHYLIKAVEDNDNVDMQIFKESVKINENMPQYALSKLLKAVNKNCDNIENLKIVMLGISYKANTDDMRRSQALVLLEMLKKYNPNVIVFDPIVDNTPKSEIESKLSEILKDANVVIVGCPHKEFLEINFSKFNNIKYLLDCWNKFDKLAINSDGINYIGIGE